MTASKHDNWGKHRIFSCRAAFSMPFASCEHSSFWNTWVARMRSGQDEPERPVNEPLLIESNILAPPPESTAGILPWPITFYEDRHYHRIPPATFFEIRFRVVIVMSILLLRDLDEISARYTPVLYTWDSRLLCDAFVQDIMTFIAIYGRALPA